jgi:hypothetical protein
VDIPQFMATLTHAADGYTASWIVDGATEVYQADDLMAVLTFLQDKLWPKAF